MQHKDAFAFRNSNSEFNSRSSEVIPDRSVRMADFPIVLKQEVGCPHSSVMNLVAAERAIFSEESIDEKTSSIGALFMENISHGQLQALSRIPADCPSLVERDHEKPDSPAFVCTPPKVMEGRGVAKRFKVSENEKDNVHILPMHAEWFYPNSLHPLEKQVVPRYFTGKSSEHTPERYIEIRNKIIAKYLENPDKILSINDCQGLADVSLQELSRIMRFLDHWGIINYRAPSEPPQCSGSLKCSEPPNLQEDLSGNIQIPSTSLRSIESLIHFDKPRSRLRAGELRSTVVSVGSSDITSDMDTTIRERLFESRCHHCALPCPEIYYQSQKEADTIICSDCFSDGKFVAGHSSIDFAKMDIRKDLPDFDGDSWSDQETLLLVEALDIYHDNWTDIAEHVGSKSKAQCIQQFLRLPMEETLLENVELPPLVMPDAITQSNHSKVLPTANGNSAGLGLEGFPFLDSTNPIMTLVSFLATSVGPRVAAACAHAALAALSKEDGDAFPERDRAWTENCCSEVDLQNSHHHQDDVNVHDDRQAVAPLSPERIVHAAKSGLSAAATKSKMFADHEERDIQRLSATIINHQLKRIELKLKQIGEIETLLFKECEQVERTRQRLAADRGRIVSNRFPAPGSASLSANTVPSVANTRPIMAPSTPTNAVPVAYPQQVNHPTMPFMPRQPMFAFGPRVPLSALQPTPNAPARPPIVGSAHQNPTMSHPMLRPVSGSNANAN